LVEILLVVGIIAILASLGVPPLLRYTQRARALEAVATMALTRQALRDYHINYNAYFDVANGNISNGLPPTVNPGLEINVGVAQYFSNSAFSVDATSPSSARFTNPDPVDFIITANGASSTPCGSSSCAISATAVTKYRLEMDNSGRVFISYDAGSTWTSF